MDQGHFYFLSDQYFNDFNDPKLMQNKEIINGKPHKRPCFYSYCDPISSLHWVIPISSQVPKYQRIYADKLARNGKCDTIAFGYVLGYEKAFLIQNMCPIDDSYIDCEYIDARTQTPVRVDGVFEKELQSKAKTVLALQRKGVRLIFPEVLVIETAILSKKSIQI